MATILRETKSTSGSPYVYYTVDATTSNRTANSIDVKVTVTSRLASSESYLGDGDNYGIRGFIEIEDIEYELVLKKKTESWSGTTKHSVSKTITVDTLTASQTLLENIKFRAIRTSGNTANAGYLKATSCKDIEIPIGHTPPSDVTYTITELNQKLIDAGITDNLFVENLSEKQFDISATLHDDADVSKYSIYNYFQVYSSQTTPIIVDFSVDDLFAGNGERDMVYIRARVDDTLGGSTWSGNPYNIFDTYNYIPYSKIKLVETSTTAKRNGQTSGKVRLNINGNLYNGEVGNVDQTNYKPIVKYKFWQTGTEEPSIYNYTIPSENIVIENGAFSVSNYEIGSSVETDVNWFNPDNAYKIKIQLSDNFTTYESNEKTINVGKATWTEYKDRVDFEKLTVKGKDVFTPISVPLSLLNSSCTGGCLYYPIINLCFVRLYVTGETFATGSRHNVVTIPEEYRPQFRTALAIDGLQDVSSSLRANINTDGTIGFVTGAAKESGDDMYISGVWNVAPKSE